MRVGLVGTPGKLQEKKPTAEQNVYLQSMKELCETLMSGFWVLHLLGEASLSPLLPSPGQI